MGATPPPIPPPEPTAGDGGEESPNRLTWATVFWALFFAAQWRGCDNAARLERIEAQNREIRALIEAGNRR